MCQIEFVLAYFTIDVFYRMTSVREFTVFPSRSFIGSFDMTYKTSTDFWGLSISLNANNYILILST